MRPARIIPILLLKQKKLYKTKQFKQPVYVGDPINAVKIFNDKEADEIVIMDIDATTLGGRPDYAFVKALANECNMPVTYGGGIRTQDDAHRIFDSGLERISINTAARDNPQLISRIADVYGSQSVIVAIDVKKDLFGKYRVYAHEARKSLSVSPLKLACEMQERGAGEILLTAVDAEGCYGGYDIKLIEMISTALKIPVIANGGAGSKADLMDAIAHGACAAAAGSMFVFSGRNKAVLITMP